MSFSFSGSDGWPQGTYSMSFSFSGSDGWPQTDTDEYEIVDFECSEGGNCADCIYCFRPELVGLDGCAEDDHACIGERCWGQGEYPSCDCQWEECEDYDYGDEDDEDYFDEMECAVNSECSDGQFCLVVQLDNHTQSQCRTCPANDPRRYYRGREFDSEECEETGGAVESCVGNGGPLCSDIGWLNTQCLDTIDAADVCLLVRRHVLVRRLDLGSVQRDRR